MKAHFPLFARLLAWSSINLVVLLLALFLTLRFQFGTQFSGFLPDISHSQTQVMAMSLINDLSATPRENWDDALARLGSTYNMEFALFDHGANRLAGAKIDPPAEAKSVMLMTAGPQQNGRPGMNPPPPPPGFPPPPNPIEPAQGPGQGPGRLPLTLPDFPQRVFRSNNPEAFWLVVHLPMDRLQIAGLRPMMLVGRAVKIGQSPLFFNPNPWIFLAIGMVVFSACFWVPLTRNLTRAIAKMTQATEAIAEGHFDVQASEKRSDELGRLGFAINRMAARLKGYITGQKRFLGDVAHELCSPLARMEVALAILEERSNEKDIPYVKDVREEVTHMRKLAHELLSFSKASLSENRIKLERILVADVVNSAVRQEHCEAGQIEINVPDHLEVQADADLLCRALANLLRNAVRYAGSAGPISISAREEGNLVVISVSDQGPGVPAEELEKLFDPFYRIDESRRSETGGVGLGLAIVKTCVKACKGTVTALHNTPTGLKVELYFLQ